MSWDEVLLIDKLESVIDYRGKTPKKSESGVVTLSAKSVKMGYIDYSKAYHISQETYKKFMVRGFPKKGDILMTTEAPLGCIAKLNREDVSVAQRLLTFRANELELSNDYLMYFLMSPRGQFELKSRATGTTVQGIKKAEFVKVKILLPPLQTQKHIADILSAYDDLIENNLKRIKLLEQAAQNIYKEWFVNLRFPGHENTTINQETGLPEGWEEKALGEFTEIKKGKNITKSTIKEGNVPVVAGGLKPAYYHNTSNTSNPVITVSASGANAGYVNMYLEDIWASDCSYIDSNLSDSVFFIHNLLLNQQELIFGMQRGAAQPHVYPKDLKRAEFVIPYKGLIQKFEEQVSAQYDMKRVLLNQNQKLKAARDILLPRLMNRTIEV
ncbi:restriction endonuclease subunit S [Flavobacteriaceae bacterium]|nr:restriction endonuclease subunit S [Flavobacteriaceae bacterium]